MSTDVKGGSSVIRLAVVMGADVQCEMSTALRGHQSSVKGEPGVRLGHTQLARLCWCGCSMELMSVKVCPHLHIPLESSLSIFTGPRIGFCCSSLLF